MFSQYIINRYTSALASHFHNGYDYTQVLEGNETFLAARYMLKKKNNLPVVLSSQHHITLIRCPSFGKSGTVWLVHSHIHSIETDPNDYSKTIVHTNNGHSFTIDMKLNTLQTKRTQASFLHSTFLKTQR